MWPMLYNEHDLVSVPGANPSDGAPDLVNEWLAAGTTAELQHRIRNALQTAGFDWMSYGSVVWREGVPATTRLFSSHAHPKWTQLYFGEGCHEADPILAQALASTLPLAWSVDESESWMLPDEQPTTLQQRFPELLRGCGIESGVIVVLPAGLRSSERTVVCLSSSRRGSAWMDDTVLGQSLMLALCLHELLSIHMSVADGTEPSPLVSPTRQEILWHLAQGQSNKQIAYRLQLSADTVKYHMRELRRHFNVRNRMQLVNSLMVRDGR